MKKSVTILELRQIVRSVIQEIADTEFAPASHAMAQAPTQPPTSASGVFNIDPSERSLSQSNLRGNNPSSQKAAAVMKVLSSRGENVNLQAIQAWMKKQDPAALFSKTNDDLANEFSQVDAGGQQMTGSPQAGSRDYDAEQTTKAKHQSDFDKYSTPKEKFK